MSTIFSSQTQLERIASTVKNYARLPVSSGTVPGALLEGIFAYVRQAESLDTYDFVDVVKQDLAYGWQVKSTKNSTPVTWMRAKIAGSQELISRSEESQEACQELGNQIINLCNRHIQNSLDKYSLKGIGYARLVVHPGCVRKVL